MKNKGTIKQIINHIGKYKFLLVLSLLISAVSVCITLYIPILAGDAIDCIKESGLTDFLLLLPILEKTAVLVVITALLQWIISVINNKITYNVVRDMRNEAFFKLQTLPLKYIDSHSNGDTLSRIISDADRFGDGLLMGFSQLFSSVVTIIITLVYMFMLNVEIAVVVAVMTPLSLFTAKFIAGKTHNLFIEKSRKNAEITALTDETINGLKTVKAFSNEEKKQIEFDKVNNELEKISVKAIFYSSLVNPTTRFINSTVYAVVCMVGAISVIGGKGITVGGLVAFLSYATQYTKPFNEISGVIAELQNSFACAERLLEFVNEKSEEKIGNGDFPKKIEGNVNIENMSFSYDENKSFMENFNLKAKKGQRIAVVGHTGCGKTTFINLLMRFYDVKGGKIEIDGTDINSVDRKSVRTLFGMVLQDTWLRNGTVKDNIRFGKPDATDEEIIFAAKKAHCHSFIKRLPDGYDTVISENADNLSAGQKQLLCIARIMLTNPAMLILDEATSSIDTRTEIKIQKAFAEIMKGRTSFIVAHRLSTVTDADCIIVIKDGKIVEQGTHNELIEKSGLYKEIFESQFSKV